MVRAGRAGPCRDRVPLTVLPRLGLYVLGCPGPSLPDARDRALPPRAAAGERPLEVFLPTKVQTWQGQQGSCVSHTATQLLEDDVLLVTGAQVDLSIAFVYRRARARRGWQDLDSGCYFRDAIAVLRTEGVPPDLLMPYKPDVFTEEPSPAARAAALRNRAAVFFEAPTSEAIVDALVARHPVGVCFTVAENVERAGKTGVLPPPEGKRLGAHCWEIDGFSRDPSRTPGPGLWFLVKNTWEKNPDGSPWGIGHPLRDVDQRFERHRRGRVWVPAGFIDGKESFDRFGLLRFPVERVA